ncbi:MAG: DUF935 family protein [Syntrophobacteraceae bacterium]
MSDPGPQVAKLIARIAGARRDPADLLTDQLYGTAAEELDGLIEPIRVLVDQAQSLEEIRDLIAYVYRGSDPTRLGEMIQRALALAELSGRFDGAGGVQ